MNREEHPFSLTINLNVLEHLGINLYSNVPSVLSEIVANSWDADATKVRINWDQDAGRIVIQDNGDGMTSEEVNSRFLEVGYRRRDGQPGPTKKGRKPMGRKGIGKLSLFSIAKTVQVETAKNGNKSAFRMRLDDIRNTIQEAEGSGIYNPEILPVDEIDFDHGTRITLDDLQRRQTIRTPEALKKRVARRFSIIGEKHNFRVFINDDEVLPSDRDYYDKIQYLWTYGNQKRIKNLCKNLDKPEPEDRTSNVEDENIKITGWLGTVKKSGDLKEGDRDNLNRIAIFVRGKVAQEDILGDFSERGVYASYLIGELHVDDLDQYEGPEMDEDDDAVTSSRQRIVEHDPRYEQLREIIGKELKHIQSRWSEFRTDHGARKALEIPEVQDWVNQLPVPDQKQAKKWFGKINRIGIDEHDQQRQLIKHSVLAFAFYRANKNLNELDRIEDANIQTILNIFGDLDSLEANLYGIIVRQRINIIRTLQDKIDKNDLEKVIQEYLFEHPWLLDSSLERPEADIVMEKRIDQLFKKVDSKLSEEAKRGRLDIKYRKNTGKHIIIELKRPEIQIHILDLIRNQIEKYCSGIENILARRETLNDPFEIIVILGKEPKKWEESEVKKREIEILKNYKARVIFYEKLLVDAYDVYQNYMEGVDNIDALSKVMQAIDDYAALHIQ